MAARQHRVATAFERNLLHDHTFLKQGEACGGGEEVLMPRLLVSGRVPGLVLRSKNAVFRQAVDHVAAKTDFKILNAWQDQYLRTNKHKVAASVRYSPIETTLAPATLANFRRPSMC